MPGESEECQGAAIAENVHVCPPGVVAVDERQFR